MRVLICSNWQSFNTFFAWSNGNICSLFNNYLHECLPQVCILDVILEKVPQSNKKCHSENRACGKKTENLPQWKIYPKQVQMATLQFMHNTNKSCDLLQLKKRSSVAEWQTQQVLSVYTRCIRLWCETVKSADTQAGVYQNLEKFHHIQVLTQTLLSKMQLKSRQRWTQNCVFPHVNSVWQQPQQRGSRHDQTHQFHQEDRRTVFMKDTCAVTRVHDFSGEDWNAVSVCNDEPCLCGCQQLLFIPQNT